MTESPKQSSQFIESLKRAGSRIGNEREVIERLGEARDWHYAFTTLARQGRALGIRFSATARTRSIHLRRLFERYNFPGTAEATFEAALQGCSKWRGLVARSAADSAPSHQMEAGFSFESRLFYWLDRVRVKV